MTSARSGINDSTRRCPKCGKEMIKLHYKIRIPKKDRKSWIEFKDWLIKTYPYYKEFLPS